jgi:hypothetical protein
MKQPHPDPLVRDDLPSWVAVPAAPTPPYRSPITGYRSLTPGWPSLLRRRGPRLALLGCGEKKFFAAPTSRKAPMCTGALTALSSTTRSPCAHQTATSYPKMKRTRPPRRSPASPPTDLLVNDPLLTDLLTYWPPGYCLPFAVHRSPKKPPNRTPFGLPLGALRTHRFGQLARRRAVARLRSLCYHFAIPARPVLALASCLAHAGVASLVDRGAGFAAKAARPAFNVHRPITAIARLHGSRRRTTATHSNRT